VQLIVAPELFMLGAPAAKTAHVHRNNAISLEREIAGQIVISRRVERETMDGNYGSFVEVIGIGPLINGQVEFLP
jgi:hypothetical protein